MSDVAPVPEEAGVHLGHEEIPAAVAATPPGVVEEAPVEKREPDEEKLPEPVAPPAVVAEAVKVPVVTKDGICLSRVVRSAEGVILQVLEE